MKQRQQGIHQASAGIRNKLHANARTGRGPKFLFSGLLTCGVCGGKFVICESKNYGCSTWRSRGESVCPNAIRVQRERIESLLLASIQQDLFTEELLQVFKQEVIRLLAERRRSNKPDQQKAGQRLQEVEQEIANLLRTPTVILNGSAAGLPLITRRRRSFTRSIICMPTESVP